MAMEKRPLTEVERLARNEYMRTYSMLPNVKAKRQAYEKLPDVRARKNAARATPEARARDNAYVKRRKESERVRDMAKAIGLKQRGFTLELWKELIKLQGNACAVCRVPFKGVPREINADHCHDEMKPRGLLCKVCNTVEGFIKKTGLSPRDYLLRLESYLSDPPAQSSKVTSKRAEPEERISNAVR